MTEQDGYKQQAMVLRVLANESRLAIISLLKEAEHSVGQIVEHLGLDQSTVSKHLAMLRNAGLVEDRRDGNRVRYALRLPCVLDLCSCVGEVLKERR